MLPARTRWIIGVVAGFVLLLFAGRWGAGVLVDRWWAAEVAPDAAGFLARWQLLRATLEIGGILVAGAWCVGHLLLVVKSIGMVQVPRRVGDLEIREVLTPESLRTGAVVLGILLGILVGRGGGEATGEILLAWRGVRFGVADPLLQLDAGVYIAQMPLWERVLHSVTLLVWLAIALSLIAHLAVGGIRLTRGGIAMTDPARAQVGGLLAACMLLGAVHEALAPMITVGAGDPWALPSIPPGVHWIVAGTWAVSALMLARWTVRPAPATVLIALTLWAGTGIMSRVILPGRDLLPTFDQRAARAVAGVNTGVAEVVEHAGPAERQIERPAGAGLWSREVLWGGVQGADTRLLALAPGHVPHGGAEVPVWLGLRQDSAGEMLIAIADDRLAPGGGPVSYRRDDSADYPGVVSWERLASRSLRPAAADTVVVGGEGGLLLTGTLQRLIVSWGAQSAAPLDRGDVDERFLMHRDPTERTRRLFPALSWGGATPVVDSGGLVWLVDGWATSRWGPFASPVEWWAGKPRYLRPAVIALVDATNGRTRFFLRADADAVAKGWAALAGTLVEPWERAPTTVRDAQLSRSWVSVQATALSRPPFVAPTLPALEGADLLPSQAWSGGRVRSAVPLIRNGRVVRFLSGTQVDGRVRMELTLWDDTTHAPLSPSRYVGRWDRFASFERLGDSVAAAGGRLTPSTVRYEVGPAGTSATQYVYLVRPGGGIALGWVNIAGAGRLGAARTPGTAWANLQGVSAPLVPDPDVPDRITEARRWAARADSALRAGDLERFGHAFEALRQVLGTP